MSDYDPTKPYKAGWPIGVRPLGWTEADNIGVDGESRLYWNGKPLVTQHELGRREFFLASIAAWATVVGAVAAVAAVVLQYLGS